MLRKPQKPPEGAKLKETADMVAWRKEFEAMKTEDHLAKMKELGLDDDDLEEFKEMKKSGIKLEDELLGETAPEQPAKPLKKKNKK